MTDTALTTERTDDDTTDDEITDDGTDTTDDMPPFRGACNAANAVAAYRFNTLDDPLDYHMPGQQAAFDPLTNTLAAFMSPQPQVFQHAAESKQLDDEDGAAPRGDRTARTFLFDAALDTDDEPDLTFEAVGQWTNSYDDERVTVETVAPWDVPDSFDGADPNDTIKRLPWGDDETDEDDDREGAHYTFDEDNQAAPRYAADAWTLDAEYVDDLRELVTAEGYEFVDSRGDDDADDEPDGDRAVFEDLLAYVSSGDTIRVTYQKKSNGGLNTYEGTITRHTTVYTGRNSGYTQGTGETWGVVFDDTDGKAKRVKIDDDEQAAIYSNSRYPYMGQVEHVTVDPASPEWFSDSEDSPLTPGDVVF